MISKLICFPSGICLLLHWCILKKAYEYASYFCERISVFACKHLSEFRNNLLTCYCTASPASFLTLFPFGPAGISVS
jgi:hypothetical protein